MLDQKELRDERLERQGGVDVSTPEPATGRDRPHTGFPPMTTFAWPAVMAALIVVPMVVAYLVSSGASPVYQARAELVYSGSGNSTADEQALATQATLLRSYGFLQEAVPESDVADLEEALTVERVDGSGVLRIAVEGDADEALSTVTALAQTYLTTITDTDIEGRAARQEVLDARMQESTGALAATQDQITALLATLDPADPDPAVQDELERARFEAARLADGIADLQQRQLQLELDTLSASNPVTLLGAPYVLEDPVAPQPLRAAAAGGLGGILVVAAIAALRLRRRRDPSA